MSTHVPVVRPGWPTGPPSAPQQQGWPGYSYPPAAGPRVASASKLSHRHLLSALAGGLAGVVAILIVVSLVAKPAAPVNCVGLTCQIKPPTGPPVEQGQLYTNPKFGFTARVLFTGVTPTVSTANNVLTLTYAQQGNTIGDLAIGGIADSNGQTAEQIVDAEIAKIAPGAQSAYVIPGSMIGYQPGFGEAFNFTPNSGNGQSQQFRVIITVSVVSNLAILAVASGPLVVFGTGKGQFNTDHPSIANLLAAVLGDPILNTVLWPGQTFP